MWATWWVWIAAGFALGALEVVVPGYVFLGFAIGAVVTGAFLGLGSALITFSLPAVLLIFAIASLAGWAALRLLFPLHKGQVKLWDTDINDN